MEVNLSTNSSTQTQNQGLVSVMQQGNIPFNL